MAGFDVIEMLNGNSIQAAGARQWYQETNYEDAKEIIRDELGNIRNSFVKVGYFLRRIKETEGYQEDGYETIWDCAKDQFGITRTTASRWMEINRRFSEGGYSPYLAEEYKGYNKSQLQEMLYLPEEKLEEVDPGMTAMEIRGSRKEPEEKTQESAETHREECEEEDEIPGQMREEDYLWCAVNLLLDEEEVARQLCPQCREAAERARCPVCGRETGEMVREENPTFDWARFQALKEGACD